MPLRIASTSNVGRQCGSNFTPIGSLCNHPVASSLETTRDQHAARNNTVIRVLRAFQLAEARAKAST